MHRTPTALLVASLLITACAPKLQQENLSLWNPIGPAQWVTEHGVTQSSSNGDISYLVSTQKFANYRLDLEFFPTAEVNSGVFVACQIPTTIDAISCHEINIWDNHPRQEFRTGSIVSKIYPPAVHIDTLDKWNRYSIVVSNGAVIVTLNGHETARLDNGDLAEGYVAVQKAEGGRIKFRNIIITPL